MKGKQILNRLDDGLRAAAAKLARLTRQAVASVTPDRLLTAQKLFTDEQLAELASVFAGVWATGELLGRAVPRARLNRLAKFADPRFPEMQVLSPREALSYFTALVPGLGVDHRTYEDQLERDVFTMAAATSMDVLYRVRDVIIRGMMEGQPAGAQSIRQILIQAGLHPENNQYSEMVYRTNVMDAYAAGHDREMADPEMQEYFPAWLYSATIDQNSRPDHAKKNDRMYSQRVPFVLVRGTTAADVCNCVLPGMYAGGFIEGALKALYSGPACEIITFQGLRLRLTVNHPVLTARGWIKAGELNKGDRLACHSHNVNSVMTGGYIKNTPTKIEKIFTAFTALAESAGAINLYGDERFISGNVKVVCPDSLLQLNVVSHICKAFRDGKFILPHFTKAYSAARRTLGAALERIMLATPCSMSGGGLLLSGISAHTGPFHNFSGRPPANSNTAFNKYSPNNTPINAVYFGDSVLAGSAILGDDVIEVRHFDYCGHVYDLQSRTGVFTVGNNTNNGIVIKNCRCTPIDLDKWEVADRIAARQLLYTGVQ